MTEDIYQNLVKSVDKAAPESIHLCDFPIVDESQIDSELEANMERVLKVVVLGRACRNKSNIKNRQPIGKMFVKADFDLPEFFREIIREELNIKEIEFTDDVRAFTSYSFKPQLRTVGPKYGKVLGKIKEALANLDGNEAMDKLNAGNPLTFDFAGNEVVLGMDDLLIDMAQVEGYVSEGEGDVTVVLDTNLSDELLEEGFVREIISKIQTMRKEAGFEVMDKIIVNVANNDKVKAVIERNLDEIKTEVLADNVEFGKIEGYEKEWNINGEKVTFSVVKNA
jgi:isoleucyl-tRNA synthetase